MWGNIAIAFLLAFITTYVITPYTIRWSRKLKAVDKPKDNSRKIHKRPIPRLGGLAIIIGFIVSTTYLIIVMSMDGSLNLFDSDHYLTKCIGFSIAIFILEIFCFFDDWKDIKPIIKLIGQIIAAITVVAFGIKMDIIIVARLKTTINSEIILNIISVLWIVGITNAINLIDGLDGLSAGIGIISCFSLLIIFVINGSAIISIILITALAGALVGFLPFNFNPARTFMGDSGSNFLGFCLAIISIIGTAKTYIAIVIIAPLFVFALPIIDTGLAIIRRIIKTKSLKGVLKADKEHLHHKIMKRGYTQKQAVLILYGISATFGIFAIILLDSGIWKALSFAFMVIAIAAIGYKDILRIDDRDKK